MNLLILDEQGTGLDLALKAQRFGHDVRHWISPERTGEQASIGVGLSTRILDWKPFTKWAHVIFLTGNAMYREEVQRLIDQGYPVLGANNAGAELELDRAKGQEVLEDAGIKTAPYQTFKNLDAAVEYVKKEKKGFAIKPWGGTADKALSHVATSAREAIFVLEDWKSKKIKGELMLQELIIGVEMGVAGWFGPGGWCEAIEENWEFKKFMNDDLGVNTGEQGTVQRFVHKSKLFDQMLKPLTEHLHTIEYVGNVSVNCIIDEKGQPWPLEFTMRPGWPAFCLQTRAAKGDPVEWMAALLHGWDRMQFTSQIIVGVVLTHGDFPAKTGNKGEDKPIYGPRGFEDHIHFQEVKLGLGPNEVGGEFRDVTLPTTAGTYIMVVTGVGSTVREASRAAYKELGKIESPTNLMYRTDIGQRLKQELPKLQAYGYAKGMEY
ncbi:MAG: hypothetical protein ACYDB1_00780 [Acidiferrobacteraceae bacterium]